LLLVGVWLIYFRYPFPIKIDVWPLTGYMARKVVYTYGDGDGGLLLPASLCLSEEKTLLGCPENDGAFF
jgi:hypothetical protein